VIAAAKERPATIAPSELGIIRRARLAKQWSNTAMEDITTKLNALIDPETRIIEGDIVKFDGAKHPSWMLKDGSPFPTGPEYLVLRMLRAVQCFKDQECLDTIIEKAGETLPDVGELNAKIPRADWELWQGQPRPPWSLQYVMYLLRVPDAAVFTVINGTTGLKIAYDRLQKRIRTLQSFTAPDAMVFVSLGTAPMKTQFGMRVRPEFVFVRAWSPSDTRIEHSSAQMIEDKSTAKKAEPETISEELNDAIRF
jgi:hypothetical protein